MLPYYDEFLECSKDKALGGIKTYLSALEESSENILNVSEEELQKVFSRCTNTNYTIRRMLLKYSEWLHNEHNCDTSHLLYVLDKMNMCYDGLCNIYFTSPKEMIETIKKAMEKRTVEIEATYVKPTEKRIATNRRKRDIHLKRTLACYVLYWNNLTDDEIEDFRCEDFDERNNTIYIRKRDKIMSVTSDEIAVLKEMKYYIFENIKDIVNDNLLNVKKFNFKNEPAIVFGGITDRRMTVPSIIMAGKYWRLSQYEKTHRKITVDDADAELFHEICNDKEIKSSSLRFRFITDYDNFISSVYKDNKKRG